MPAGHGCNGGLWGWAECVAWAETAAWTASAPIDVVRRTACPDPLSWHIADHASPRRNTQVQEDRAWYCIGPCCATRPWPTPDRNDIVERRPQQNWDNPTDRVSGSSISHIEKVGMQRADALARKRQGLPRSNEADFLPLSSTLRWFTLHCSTQLVRCSTVHEVTCGAASAASGKIRNTPGHGERVPPKTDRKTLSHSRVQTGHERDVVAHSLQQGVRGVEERRCAAAHALGSFHLA